MRTTEILESLTQQLSRAIPVANDLKVDAEAKIRDVLKKRLDELQILSMEEFENQLAVLQRAEKRIGELESRLSELEKA